MLRRATLMALFVLTSKAAHADEPRWSHHLALLGEIGVAAPVGTMAFLIQVSPARWLAIEPGIGIVGEGARESAMIRIRPFPDESATFSLAFGLATGTFVWNTSTFGSENQPVYELRWSRAYFGLGEIALEKRTDRDLQWRVAMGVRRLLDPRDAYCHSLVSGGCDHQRAGEGPSDWGLYFTAALGFAAF